MFACLNCLCMSLFLFYFFLLVPRISTIKSYNTDVCLIGSKQMEMIINISENDDGVREIEKKRNSVKLLET